MDMFLIFLELNLFFKFLNIFFASSKYFVCIISIPIFYYDIYCNFRRLDIFLHGFETLSIIL